jgi:hypothetical protein
VFAFAPLKLRLPIYDSTLLPRRHDGS